MITQIIEIDENIHLSTNEYKELDTDFSIMTLKGNVIISNFFDDNGNFYFSAAYSTFYNFDSE